jgi:hypothetical protein
MEGGRAVREGSWTERNSVWFWEDEMAWIKFVTRWFCLTKVKR